MSGAPAGSAPSAPALSLIGRASVTACGLGLLRPASGTWGSLPPVVAVLVMLAFGAPWWLVSAAMLATALKASLLCLHYGPAAEREFAGKDPSSVVIDEVAGQAVTLLILPWWALGGEAVVGALTTRQAMVAIAAFLLFRISDIVKPPPARGLQRLHGGAGILVDDLIAGGYALGATWIVAALLMDRSNAVA